MKTWNGLCIGGPRDGEWIETTSPYLHVPIFEGFKETSDILREAEMKVKTVTYLATTFYAESEEFIFWRPQDQSVNESLIKLFKNYRKPE